MKRMPAHLRGASATLLLFSALMFFPGCKKHGHPPRSAKGSLQNENGACLPGIVHGTWYNGVKPSRDTNYVEIRVNVSQTGNYRIATNLQNGVTLSDSGDFTSLGLNMVRLKATGSFINPGATNFTVTFDTTACQFQINVQDTLADNTWRFTAGGHVYKGTAIAGNEVLPQNRGSIFGIHGQMASGSKDTLLLIETYSPHYIVDTGTYSTITTPQALDYFLLLKDNQTVYFRASRTTVPPQIFELVVTSMTFLSSLHFRVTGIFNGTAVNAAGTAVPITNGAFNVILQ